MESSTPPQQPLKESASPTDFLDVATLQEIARLRRRVEELITVSQVATMLTEARDLNKVLQRTAEAVVELMNVKASSIRLIDPDNDELVTRAVHNLSQQYLSKGPLRLSRA